MLHIKDAALVEREVRTIAASMFPDFDFSFYDATFQDVLYLFHGRYTGYRACNTDYHDLAHTLDVLLATARLAHGVHLAREELTPGLLELGLVGALLHDTGYIQAEDDLNGTGAKYTLTHVNRSIDFMREYCLSRGPGEDFIRDCGHIIMTTDLVREIDDIEFASPGVRLMGFILGTADVVGQMADRIYLEKLPFLYQEFDEAGVSDFESEYDLLKKTIGFYKFMNFRMAHHLGDVRQCYAAHFKARFDRDEDLYAVYAQRNMDFLDHVLKEHGPNYGVLLRGCVP